MFSSVVFYMFAIFIIISAIGTIIAKNPVYSVLLLIFTFFNAVGIFVLLKAEFLASILIIVYVGAIATLFLFVVMLINLGNVDKKVYLTKGLIFALILMLGIFVELFFLLKAGVSTLAPLNSSISDVDMASVSNFGIMLFNNYYYVFFIAALILTISMIGSVFLSMQDKDKVNKRQSMSDQKIRMDFDSVHAIDVKKEKGN